MINIGTEGLKVIEEIAYGPLTIEQLKELEVGDWVWVEYKKLYGVEEFYSQIGSNLSGKYVKNPMDLAGVFLFMEDYNKTWIAYKNKEIWQYCTLIERLKEIA